jgi:hypothetical protein
VPCGIIDFKKIVKNLKPAFKSAVLKKPESELFIITHGLSRKWRGVLRRRCRDCREKCDWIGVE